MKEIRVLVPEKKSTVCLLNIGYVFSYSKYSGQGFNHCSYSKVTKGDLSQCSESEQNKLQEHYKNVSREERK